MGALAIDRMAGASYRDAFNLPEGRMAATALMLLGMARGPNGRGVLAESKSVLLAADRENR
jgi:hypothetical protein